MTITELREMTFWYSKTVLIYMEHRRNISIKIHPKLSECFGENRFILNNCVDILYQEMRFLVHPVYLEHNKDYAGTN